MVGIESKWASSCDSHRARFSDGGKDHWHEESRFAWGIVATSMVEVVWKQIAIRVRAGGMVVWRKGVAMNVVDPWLRLRLGRVEM